MSLFEGPREYRVVEDDEVDEVEVNGLNGFEAVNNMLLDIARERCSCKRWNRLHAGSCIIIYHSDDIRVYAASPLNECRAGLIHTVATLHTAAAGLCTGVAKFFNDDVLVLSDSAEANIVAEKLRAIGVKATVLQFERERAHELDKWFGFLTRHNLPLSKTPFTSPQRI
ncbi:hypothetical protein CSUB_C0942 [Candidatus Caldarchaeum subterraneum]|uniref:Uncharacterized protein n=1 Tax=Caldiarchaeum subterraneum TaxID=311458 RepID=E6N6R9_CALS0|nr:hypothetical protein HGMM_F17C01C16 [Candidatus Caldarchaeum subterraneum]BAJ50796.1 hypothetical protein CSUB_C0942 [Candidatus Caldarchaeum subterraneum]